MTYRAPHTIPPKATFPEPLADPRDPRLKHRLQPWDGGAADVVLVGMPFDHGGGRDAGGPGGRAGRGGLSEGGWRLRTT